MISLYKKIIYDEDARIISPYLYKSDRLCEHKTIKGNKEVQSFLNTFRFPISILNEQLTISVLWNLPRRVYNEKQMWVCLSGDTHNGYAPFTHFVVSDNIIDEISQNRAMKMIEYLNKM